MDDTSAGDARLVEAALGGDKDALAALVTRHRATAVALAARVLGTPDLARDAAQEAAVAALAAEAAERIQRFTPAASPQVGPGGQGQVDH